MSIGLFPLLTQIIEVLFDELGSWIGRDSSVKVLVLLVTICFSASGVTNSNEVSTRIHGGWQDSDFLRRSVPIWNTL
jgi:hypothetical protein